MLSVAELRLYEVLAFEANAELRVADLTGKNLNRLGTDTSLFASNDYLLTQEWSRQLMIHPQARDGIRYHSRKNPKKFDYRKNLITRCTTRTAPREDSGSTGVRLSWSPPICLHSSINTRWPSFGDTMH